MDGKAFFSRSSARTSSAIVWVGWVSWAISGSASIAFTTAWSREKNALLRCSTWACGETWLRPLNTAIAKSGAGTWKAKLSQTSPASSA